MFIATSFLYLIVAVHLHSLQLAQEPKSELYYDTAFSKLMTLLSAMSITRSSEPEFDLISEDTLGGATIFFDISIDLLNKMRADDLFPKLDVDKQAIALHDSFQKLLNLLVHCLRSEKYASRLAIATESAR